MFGGEPNSLGQVLDKIELTYAAGEPQVSPENEQWGMVILTAVDLKWFVTEEATGDQWILQTPGGYEAYFHFRRTDEIDPWAGESIWKIIMWEDKPSMKRLAGAAPEDPSWGLIKILFL